MTAPLLNFTTPWTPPEINPEPLMSTCVPTGPLFGLRLVITGGISYHVRRASQRRRGRIREDAQVPRCPILFIEGVQIHAHESRERNQQNVGKIDKPVHKNRDDVRERRS